MNQPSEVLGTRITICGVSTQPGSDPAIPTGSLSGEFILEGQPSGSHALRRLDAPPGPDTDLALQNWGNLSNILPSQAYPAVLHAIGLCKAAAARANFELGAFNGLHFAGAEISARAVYESIAEVCLAMAAGQHDHEFVVDVLQGGAGTSLHMNANEVIALHANERLLRHLGHVVPGDPAVLPIKSNDIVNYGQSTNDVIPTAARIGVLSATESLVTEMLEFESTLRERASQDEFRTTPLVGRTHLQDAVPVTMAQVFLGYADTLAAARRHLEVTSRGLQECTLGATAVGSGLTSLPGYRERVVECLNELLESSGARYQLRPADNYFATTSSLLPFSAYSNALATYAVELEKIANDIRLYASGPRAGFGELKLPALQPGSSIMPGKVNPVDPEMLDQTSFIIQGNALTVALCARAGQLQLNVMGPTVLWKLSESISLLQNALGRARRDCFSHITVNVEGATENIERSLVAATALKPKIGYRETAAVVREALKSGTSIREVLQTKPELCEGATNIEALTAQILGTEALLDLTLPPRAPAPISQPTRRGTSDSHL
ncbi:MAG: aspartate ammonia-lyase [Deltaproteobacteria bacterium]|nr:aspartate ammonia-lyase [Deltaproteobacteria bacterium]